MFAVKRPLFVGLLFDLAGAYPAAVHAHIQERRKRRAKSVDDALRSDVAAIAGDMRQALNKWASANG